MFENAKFLPGARQPSYFPAASRISAVTNFQTERFLG